MNVKKLEEEIRRREQKLKELKSKLAKEKRRRRRKVLCELGELLLKSGITKEGLRYVDEKEVKKIIEREGFTLKDF